MLLELIPNKATVNSQPNSHRPKGMEGTISLNTLSKDRVPMELPRTPLTAANRVMTSPAMDSKEDTVRPSSSQPQPMVSNQHPRAMVSSSSREDTEASSRVRVDMEASNKVPADMVDNNRADTEANLKVDMVNPVVDMASRADMVASRASQADTDNLAAMAEDMITNPVVVVMAQEVVVDLTVGEEVTTKILVDAVGTEAMGHRWRLSTTLSLSRDFPRM